MKKSSLLDHLYAAHAADIMSLNNKFEGIICPICFKPYNHEDIKNKELTDGHIWPKDIRGKNKVASSQRVLLCANCNHSSGSKGDKQMQLAEKLKKGEQSGNLYGERHINLIEKPGSEPISLQASISINNDNETVNITGNWNRSNPIERRRFEELVNKNEKFSYVIHPYKEIKQGLPIAGWITSSYLFAYYRLGYRYILHPSLHPIRDFILQSFEKDIYCLYRKLESDVFWIRQYQDTSFENPMLKLIVPLDGKSYFHLQVDFLDYQIKLPFHSVPGIINELIISTNPLFNDQLPELQEITDHVYLNIDCCKLDNHDCVFDYVMGKPFTQN